jgi:hypothetical protein
MRKKSIITSSLFLIFSLVLLAGCGTQVLPTDPTPLQQTPPEASTRPMDATATPALPATPTPQAQIAAELILWAPETADPALVQTLTGQLSAYAQSAGLAFESHALLAAPQLGAQTRVVVSVAPAAELAALAGQVPTVQFLSVLVPGTVVGGNVHAFEASASTSDQRAFLAGYALALITPDYRVGVISQSGTAEGQLYRDGFVTGARFFCGLCRSKYGPVLYYPFTAEIGDPASAVEWQAAADSLLANAVSAVFVQPEVSSAELITYLAGKGVVLVGVDGQPGLDVPASWVGVLTAGGSADVVSAVEKLLNGEAPVSGASGVALGRINADLMSEGRQILFERIRQQMLDGQVKTLP